MSRLNKESNMKGHKNQKKNQNLLHGDYKTHQPPTPVSNNTTVNIIDTESKTQKSEDKNL